MIRALFIGLLIYFGLKVIFQIVDSYLKLKGGRRVNAAGSNGKARPSHQPSSPTANGGRPSDVEELVEDPNCHVLVPISKAHTVDVNGVILHFCSAKCSAEYRSRDA